MTTFSLNGFKFTFREAKRFNAQELNAYARQEILI